VNQNGKQNASWEKDFLQIGIQEVCINYLWTGPLNPVSVMAANLCCGARLHVFNQNPDQRS